MSDAQKRKTDVLLIQDDPSQAALITKMLSEGAQEFSAHHVRHPEEGLSLLQNRNFDVILLDLGPLDSRGLETALAVRNRAKQTPIVAVVDDEEAALKALHSDIHDYLVKGRITDDLLKRSLRYVTQLKRAREEQLQCEQTFSSFMLNVPVAAWIKDLHGRYVYGNAEHERVFAMPLSEFAGKRDDEFLPPDTARQFRENDERVLAEGESLQTIEVLRQANGIDRHFIVNKFPIMNPDGRPAYVAGIGLDITERVRAEEALQKSERKFAKVFHEVPALLAISTLKEGRIRRRQRHDPANPGIPTRGNDRPFGTGPQLLGGPVRAGRNRADAGRKGIGEDYRSQAQGKERPDPCRPLFRRIYRAQR